MYMKNNSLFIYFDLAGRLLMKKDRDTEAVRRLRMIMKAELYPGTIWFKFPDILLTVEEKTPAYIRLYVILFISSHD